MLLCLQVYEDIFLCPYFNTSISILCSLFSVFQHISLFPTYLVIFLIGLLFIYLPTLEGKLTDYLKSPEQSDTWQRLNKYVFN